MSRAITTACHIFADSQSTRRDLIELLGVVSDKITVIYPGVDTRFAPVSDADILKSVAERYQLPEKFILGLGTLQPRKNFDGLIEAFGRLIAHDPGTEALLDLQLVIGGGPGWLHEEIMHTVRQCGLEERVHFAGFVRDEDLPALYSLARVFAFPSWYEGFGLPVLEAQACGTPVVAANNSSLPEVVGSGGILVDAANRDELALALSRALTDADHRAQLVSAGRLQATRFTWDKAAQQLLLAYKRFALANG